MIKNYIAVNDEVFFGEENYNGNTTSQLIEIVFNKQKIVERLGNSSTVTIFDLLDKTNKLPKISFIFNKGYVKGKTICILTIHNVAEIWEIQFTNPFVRNDNREWVETEFRTKKRENDFYDFIHSGNVWTERYK